MDSSGLIKAALRAGWIPKTKPIKVQNTKEIIKGSQVTCVGMISNRFKPKEIPNPEWLLFEKCMRGDASDNVFSAYPRIRKNKLLEAFEDRTNQGFAWNNMMLQRWVDHNNVEHRVKDDY